jgi:hypothetical protein
MVASAFGSLSLVELLLSHRADVNALGSRGSTALMHAAGNCKDGMAIFSRLCLAGAEVNATTVEGRTSLAYAFCIGNGPLVRFVASHVRTGASDLQELKPGPESSDPIGCFQEGTAYGASPRWSIFSDGVRKRYPPKYMWAVLRLKESAFPDVFPELEECQDPLLWRWMGLELLTTRHPHAARANNLVAVGALTDIWMNPLLPDREGRLPIELTTDARIRAHLTKYAVQRPRREVMRWYGPFLMARVRTLLLTMQRWRSVGLCSLPKDVVRLVIMQLMALESAPVEVDSVWAVIRKQCAEEGLMATQDVSLWRWAGLEMLTSRIGYGETLLHAATRHNETMVVYQLMVIWMNPLLRNANGARAEDLTEDANLRAELIRYRQQPPRREVMRWYWPYLMERVHTLLLMAQRRRNMRLRQPSCYSSFTTSERWSMCDSLSLCPRSSSS